MKNLVYYSVGNHSVYAEMLKLSIQTIDESNDDFIDILIITDITFYEKNLVNLKRPNLFFHFIEEPKNNDEICFNKYIIFDWDKIDEYQKILYLDTDTLVSYDLKKLFNKCNSINKLHVVVEDYSIENHNRIQFGFVDYDKNQIKSFSKLNSINQHRAREHILYIHPDTMIRAIKKNLFESIFLMLLFALRLGNCSHQIVFLSLLQ